MKRKLGITGDERTLPEATRRTKRKGTPLSRSDEQAVRAASAPEIKSFAARWRGKFKTAERRALLAKKYL